MKTSKSYFEERKHDPIHCEGAHLIPKRNFPECLQTDFNRDFLKTSAWFDKVGQLLESENGEFSERPGETVLLGLVEFILHLNTLDMVSIEDLIDEINCWQWKKDKVPDA